jgi:NAD-dependent deacetylase
MLVIGTSAVVAPACDMPVLAKNSGAKVIEVNLEETPLTYTVSDLIIRESAGIVMPLLVEQLRKIRQ